MPSIKFICRRSIVLVIQAFALTLMLCAPLLAKTEPDTSPATKTLVEKFGTFRAITPATSFSADSDNPNEAANVGNISSASRAYTSPAGERFVVRVVSTNSESAAYALLTYERNLITNRGETLPTNFGLSEFLFPRRAILAKGRVFVDIEAPGSKKTNGPLQDFSNAFAATLPNGESEVPVLVKHLPDGEKSAGQASYFVSLESLKSFVASPLLDVMDFEGAEAVAANYDSGQLLIVEFQTPQLATDNDQRITNRLRELIGQNVLLPSVYRRVGNYGVFVFKGSSESAANQLIDQVKYEQVTKWLGDSPYPLLEAQRAYRETTLNMLVSVVKASGLAILICFSVGGLFGGLLFIRRRAQQRTIDAYSDAGGMLRLNLDEMTPETNAARLLGPGQ